MADRKEVERERERGGLAVNTVRKQEGEMKEKHVTESKVRGCVVYLIACSTDRNVLSVFLASSPKYLESPHETFSAWSSTQERITKKFHLW